MRSNVPIGRRSVFAYVATVVTMYFGGGARSGSGASESDDVRPPPERGSVTAEGRFPATVDRIVDGDHVVLLVAARGEVVAQYDVTRDTLPTVRAGDRLLVTVADGALTAVRTETGPLRDIDRVQPTAATWR